MQGTIENVRNMRFIQNHYFIKNFLKEPQWDINKYNMY